MLALSAKQTDDAMNLFRSACQLTCILVDTHRSAVRLGEIKFSTNDVSRLYAFAGREGAVGSRP